ncbi:MAG: 1,4-alpha-glucan branching enzyme, partial [Opitutaceae bacterium]|nr:1,4-alpha-glucan branching enzyme [Opitutaceae bacterium]
MIIPLNELNAFLGNHQANPHGWLGMHPLTQGTTTGVVVRAFMATAVKCAVIDLETAEARSYSMEQLAPEGFFEIFIPRKSIFRYQLRYETSWGDI